MAFRKIPLSKEKALDRLTSLCARSEQCESDLKRKLFNWGLSDKDRGDIIEYLIVNRYLDDARFAKSFAKDKAKFSSWGPLKIKTELFKRRIRPELISNAISDVETSVWKEGILRCARSKAGNLDFKNEDAEYENRRKLFRYLVSRGFPSTLSSKAVNFILRSLKSE